MHALLPTLEPEVILDALDGPEPTYRMALKTIEAMRFYLVTELYRLELQAETTEMLRLTTCQNAGITHTWVSSFRRQRIARLNAQRATNWLADLATMASYANQR